MIYKKSNLWLCYVNCRIDNVANDQSYATSDVTFSLLVAERVLMTFLLQCQIVTDWLLILILLGTTVGACDYWTLTLPLFKTEGGLRMYCSSECSCVLFRLQLFWSIIKLLDFSHVFELIVLFFLPSISPYSKPLYILLWYNGGAG